MLGAAVKPGDVLGGKYAVEHVLGAGGMGEPFIVMEHLEDRDLDAELQARGPLPPHVAVD